MTDGREILRAQSCKTASASNLFHTSGAAKTLTGAYVTGDSMYVGRHSTGRLHVTYTKGTEASCQIDLMVSHDGSNFRPVKTLPPASGGATVPTLDTIELSASDDFAVAVSLSADLWIAFRAKVTTPGGAPGTLLLAMTGGIDL